MNNESAGHGCNACNKTFRRSDDLDKHIEDKHEEKTCTYCDKVLRNEASLINHTKQCLEHGTKTVNCNKCDKKFTNFAMRRHKDVCQGKQEFDCPECGMISTTAIASKNHYDKEHKMELVQSREVCFHWRNGNCTNVNCRFAHVGIQKKRNLTDTSRKSTRVPACKNGSSCEWLDRGSCSYYHARVGVQRPWVHKEGGKGGQQSDRPQRNQQGQEGRFRQEVRSRQAQGDRHQQPSRNQTQYREQQLGRLPCKFDGRCERIPNCPFIHSLQDFPLLQARRNPVIRNNVNQRRK